MENYYIQTDQGQWLHRPLFKIIINGILRKIQFWTNNKYLIVSVTDFTKKIPVLIKYSFCKIRCKN